MSQGKLTLDFKALAKGIHHAVKENPDASVRLIAQEYQHGPVALGILRKLKYVKASRRGNRPGWKVSCSPGSPEFDSVVEKAKVSYEKHLKEVEETRHNTGLHIAKIWNNRHKHGKGPQPKKQDTRLKKNPRTKPEDGKFDAAVSEALQNMAASMTTVMTQPQAGRKFSWPEDGSHAETLREISVLLKEIQVAQHNIIQKLFTIMFDL